VINIIDTNPEAAIILTNIVAASTFILLKLISDMTTTLRNLWVKEFTNFQLVERYSFGEEPIIFLNCLVK
jgi:hypothetical protein